VKDLTPTRRRLLARALALGALTTLPGCNYEDPTNPDLADKFLHAMSSFDDRVQQALFSRHTLAPTFAASQITQPPRFNAFYDISQAPVVDPATFKLELGGQIQNRQPWTLAQLQALPGQQSQITRLICVEGWRVIGQWSGIVLADFLPMRGRLLFQHRHGIRPTPADHPGAAIPRRAAHPRLRRAGAAQDSHQARLQEPEIGGLSRRHQCLSRRLLGRSGLQLVQRLVTPGRPEAG
jgi:hypothetical protein